MMSELESALRELEIATAALAAIPGNDVERFGAALELRLKAITRVAAVPAAMLSAAEREQALRRLEAASRAGGTALHQLAATQDAVTAEWSQWNRVSRALAAGDGAEAKRIDCSA